MDATSVKERILKALREALIEKDEDLLGDNDSTNGIPDNSWPEVLFAEKFLSKGGGFLFCDKSKDLVDGVAELFKKNDLFTVFCLNKDLSEVLDACGVKHVTSISKDQPIDFVVTQVDALVSDSGSVVVSFDRDYDQIVSCSGATLVLFATTNQVVRGFSDVSKLLRSNNQDQIPSYTHVIEIPKTSDKFDFPQKTYVFLRYVKK